MSFGSRIKVGRWHETKWIFQTATRRLEGIYIFHQRTVGPTYVYCLVIFRLVEVRTALNYHHGTKVDAVALFIKCVKTQLTSSHSK